MDQQIIDHELRARDHVVVTYRGHQQEICSLKWSPSSQHSCSQGPCLCPFESNLLVSGGGERDECIKFWNTHTGACLKSVDCGSQVPCLLRSKNKRELLSSHGYTKSQLSEWKYPSLVKMVDLTEHTSTVLFMTQSPDGRTVASAAASGDERLLFLNMFEPLNEKSTKPFTHERDDLEQILSQYCIEDSVSVEIHSIT